MAGVFYSGLDYTACKVSLDALDFDVAAVWPGLQIMEREARNVLNQK